MCAAVLSAYMRQYEFIILMTLRSIQEKRLVAQYLKDLRFIFQIHKYTLPLVQYHPTWTTINFFFNHNSVLIIIIIIIFTIIVWLGNKCFYFDSTIFS